MTNAVIINFHANPAMQIALDVIRAFNPEYKRVPAGASYTFAPVSLAVPVSADTVTVSGLVAGFAYSLNYNPLYSGLSANGSQDVVTNLAVPYVATIYPERPVYDQGSSVNIGGSMHDVWGNVLSTFPVVVSIRNNGYTRVLTTTTDGNGAYSVAFTPASGEAGVYDMGVRHPDIVGEAATSSFTIVGFGLSYSNYSVSMRQGSSYSFDVTLKNNGGSALAGLTYSVENVSGSGITVSVPQNMPQTLAAGSQQKITLTCAAAASATSAAFNFKVTDINGFTRNMLVTVTAVAPQVVPQVTPQLFSMGITAGDVKT